MSPTHRLLVILAALLSLAACNTPPQPAAPTAVATVAPATAVSGIVPPPTSAPAPTFTVPPPPAQTQASAAACGVVTAADVSLVIPNPPAPMAQSGTVNGVLLSNCSYLDGNGGQFHLSLGNDPQTVAQIMDLLPTLNAQPGLVKSSANGIDVYVSGGPNQNTSGKGDGFTAFVIKGNTTLSIMAGAASYHYAAPLALAVVQQIASRLP